MKVAIMQPYFLPYLGYWQLMNSVDTFVVYDDIQYTKKGWINRNQFLLNGRAETFSLPLKKASEYLDVRERQLSDDRDQHLARLSRRLAAAYRAAPCYEEGKDLLDRVLAASHVNLFAFLYNSIEAVHSTLGMATSLLVSSRLAVPAGLAGQERVIATCKAVGAKSYLNPIGGVRLYDHQAFDREGIRLEFHRAELREYPQFGNPFVRSLSIIDAVMFVGSKLLREEYLRAVANEADSQ